MIKSGISILASENNTKLYICKLGCITRIENSVSQMVKIEERENFHPRRKMTSSLRMIISNTPYLKVRKGLKSSGS